MIPARVALPLLDADECKHVKATFPPTLDNSCERGHWHVVIGAGVAELWAHDGNAPLAICISSQVAHLTVDRDNAAVEGAEVIATGSPRWSLTPESIDAALNSRLE